MLPPAQPPLAFFGMFRKDDRAVRVCALRWINGVNPMMNSCR